MELKPYKSKECMSALKGGLIAVKLCCGGFCLIYQHSPFYTHIHTHTLQCILCFGKSIITEIDRSCV